MEKVNTPKEIGCSHLSAVLDYENPLCDAIKKIINESEFEFYIFIEGGVGDFSKVDDLRLSRDGVLGVSYLPLYLMSEYGEDTQNLLICDDVMTQSNQITYEASHVRPICIGDHVLWWDKLSELKADGLLQLIYSTNVSWHFLSIIIRPIFSDTLVTDLTVVDGVKHGLGAFEVLEIVVGAFDGEGFLHCQKNQEVNGSHGDTDKLIT